MNLTHSIFWFTVGILTEALLALSLKWSVNLIQPSEYRKSRLIVVGSALLRWVFMGLILLIAISQHIYLALLYLLGLNLAKFTFVIWISRQMAMRPEQVGKG